jgi:hypothetical protein
MHYYRLRKHGSLDIANGRPRPPVDRFWEKVDRSGECWLWTAGRRGDGYGAFQAESNRQVGAHRFSYELHHGEIPVGMVVMHSCDTPLCVNPDHLSVGTSADNAADSARKARRPRGSDNSQAKLTEEQVLALRAQYARGGITQKELAAQYSISHALVSFIVTRRAWRHI